MLKNKADSERNIEEFSREIKKAAEENKESFLTWFNNNENIRAVISSGYKDFFCHILKREVYDLTKENSNELIAMEIGCGGGRIMNAAAKYFKRVIGLDIHDNLEDTDNFLRQLGNNNFETKKIQGLAFPLLDKSLDFIYSIIVFQHIMKIETFLSYLKETSRVLKDTGVAIIYFGRPKFLSGLPVKNSLLNKLLVMLDRIFFEELYLNIFKGGFSEYPEAETNYVNLVVSVKKAKKMFSRYNLKIIDRGISDKNNMYGCQYYFSVRK
ncbi:MAG: methyltransferase domain-containing protein [Patescibacteria group bacterium]